jgi:hypothetical protein
MIYTHTYSDDGVIESLIEDERNVIVTGGFRPTSKL